MIENFELVAIPTKTSFRGIKVREALLFKGSAGWSEFSPFLEYDAKESSTWLKAAIEGANTPWPDLKRTSIAVNATLPHVNPSQVPELLSAFPGCKTIKIKVNDFESSEPLIAAALNFVPDARIRLDVNGGWSLENAIKHLTQFKARFGSVFEYIEQPVASVEDLAALKKQVGMKIAVDESIRKDLSGDLEQLRNVADVAIIKWQPSGGFNPAHEIADRIKLPVVISSALDTGVGISHAAALAASFEELPYACGLGTVALLESDICEPAVLPRSGTIAVRKAEPDFALLEKYRASDERYEWWRNRLREVGRML